MYGVLPRFSAPGGQGVARPKPSDAGEGSAPPHRAKLVSGWELTRMWSIHQVGCFGELRKG